MKVHTSLSEAQVRDCLAIMQDEELVGRDVTFDVLAETGSRSSPHGYDVHLASSEQFKPDGSKRKTAAYAGGTGLRYAATQEEWGFFLGQLFREDERAVAGPYKGHDDFHVKTRYEYS